VLCIEEKPSNLEYSRIYRSLSEVNAKVEEIDSEIDRLFFELVKSKMLTQKNPEIISKEKEISAEIRNL
jgi:hypothetical protein